MASLKPIVVEDSVVDEIVLSCERVGAAAEVIAGVGRLDVSMPLETDEPGDEPRDEPGDRKARKITMILSTHIAMFRGSCTAR